MIFYILTLEGKKIYYHFWLCMQFVHSIYKVIVNINSIFSINYFTSYVSLFKLFIKFGDLIDFFYLLNYSFN